MHMGSTKLQNFALVDNRLKACPDRPIWYEHFLENSHRRIRKVFGMHFA